MAKSLNPLKIEVHYRNADTVKNNAAEDTAVPYIILLFYFFLIYVIYLYRELSQRFKAVGIHSLLMYLNTILWQLWYCIFIFDIFSQNNFFIAVLSTDQNNYIQHSTFFLGEELYTNINQWEILGCDKDCVFHLIYDGKFWETKTHLQSFTYVLLNSVFK